MTNTGRNLDSNPNHGDENFPSTGNRLAWQTGKDLRWSQLYTPSAEAVSHDGADSSTNHAIGSYIADAFVYVTIKVTGRKEVVVPGSGGPLHGARGTKCRITFAAGTEDEATANGWIVEN